MFIAWPIVSRHVWQYSQQFRARSWTKRTMAAYDTSFIRCGERLPRRLISLFGQQDSGLGFPSSQALSLGNQGLQFCPLRIVKRPTGVRLHHALGSWPQA
jgi:hypothetical protein